MPAGKPHKSVPLFSKTELDIANDCAVLLWNGISFETGKETTSDETLMSYFSIPVFDFISAQATHVTFDKDELHELIIVAGLKAMFRKKNELSYPQFETFLTRTLQHLHNDIKLAKTDAEKWAVTGEYVREGGKQLVDINVKTNAGYRVPFSSRILFFAMPTVPIANLSNGLAKALNLPSRAEYAVRPFYQIFSTGFAKNQQLLKSYKMPKSRGILDDNVYSQAAQSDWWQRRVLDIALLLKFNVASKGLNLPKIPII